MSAHPYRFPKYERIKLKRQIQRVFKEGRMLKANMVEAKFYIEPYDSEQFPREYYIKVGFSVPKRFFKQAVKRNKIRRWLREAYRLHRLPLLEALKKHQKSLKVFFLYRNKAFPSYTIIAEDVKNLLAQLLEAVEQSA